MQGQTIRYSTAFKLKVISEIESGKHTIAEVRRIYDIGGTSTVQKWIQKYGKNYLLNKVIRIQMKDEKDKIKELKNHIKVLERALSQSQVDNLCWRSLVEAINEQYGIDAKKFWFQAAACRASGSAQENNFKVSIEAICRFFQHSRQAYYQWQHRSFKTFIKEQQVIDEVRHIRKKQPKVDGRKLLLDLQDSGFQLGRDRLFNILRRNHMLVKRKKRVPWTTNSKHWFRKYTNLIKGIVLTGSNQVFVSDITYLRIKGDFCYLSLITDAWSRKIVGWNVSSSFCVKGPIRALRMALKNVPHPEGLIHHSDRGIQYCCQDYVKILKDHHVLISMTEENHCGENTIAERVNGILKDEFLFNETLPFFNVAKELTRESINTYNNERRHMSLNYQIPAKVHDVVLQ